jgi:hypothetical protein
MKLNGFDFIGGKRNGKTQLLAPNFGGQVGDEKECPKAFIS